MYKKIINQMRNHRYTNLEQFKSEIISKTKIDSSEFQIIELEIEETERFEEENVNYLRQEDETIQSLHVCSSKSFTNCIPSKSEEELNNELSSEDLFSIQNNNIKFKCKIHPERNAAFICVNNSCPLTFYCLSCRNEHNKTCNRKLMAMNIDCLLYTSPSPRDLSTSRMPSSA